MRSMSRDNLGLGFDSCLPDLYWRIREDCKMDFSICAAAKLISVHVTGLTTATEPTTAGPRPFTHKL